MKICSRHIHFKGGNQKVSMHSMALGAYPLQKHAHAIYRDFFQNKKFKISLEISVLDHHVIYPDHKC